MINDNAVANVLVDVNFIEDTFAAMGQENLGDCFTELRSVCISISRLSHVVRAAYVHGS